MDDPKQFIEKKKKKKKSKQVDTRDRGEMVLKILAENTDGLTAKQILKKDSGFKKKKEVNRILYAFEKSGKTRREQPADNPAPLWYLKGQEKDDDLFLFTRTELNSKN